MANTYFLRLNEMSYPGVLDMSLTPFNEELKALQEQVGGTIEHFYLHDSFTKRYIDVWIDDEGKLKNLKPSILLYHDGEMIDYISGPCVFTRFDNEGYTWGLLEDDMNFIREFLYHLPIAEYETRDGSKGYALVVEM